MKKKHNSICKGYLNIHLLKPTSKCLLTLAVISSLCVYENRHLKLTCSKRKVCDERRKTFFWRVCSHCAANGMSPLLAKSICNPAVALNSWLTIIAQSSFCRERLPDSISGEKTPPDTLHDWCLGRWSYSPCMTYQTPVITEDFSRKWVAMNEPDLSLPLCPGHPWHFKHSWDSLSLRPFLAATKGHRELQSEDYDRPQCSQPQSSEVWKALW